MKNKYRVIGDLYNDDEKLAKLLISSRDNTGWNGLPSTIFITSDKKEFEDDFDEALRHEINWLNVDAEFDLNK